jgi:uncharacterized protein (TIGR00251 family)
MSRIITVRVTPNASQNSVIEIDGSTYRVRLTRSPIDGKANEQLICLLAQHFKTVKSNIQIKKGLTSKNKLVVLEG